MPDRRGRDDEAPEPLPPSWRELFEGLQATLARAEAERAGIAALLERTKTELQEQQVELDALRRARSAAESTNLVRGQILAMVNRTMRTPADSLLGLTGLLRMGALLPTQRAYVDALQGAAEVLRRVLNDSYDFSRLESGTLPLEPIEFDFRVMVEDLAASLTAEAEAKGVTLRLSWHQEAPRRVTADPGRIRQVLTAIIRDGLSRVERGAVELGIQPEPGRPGVRIVVEDSGPPIPEDLLATVFEPFVRSGMAAERGNDGGLALPIARNLAQLMGGELSVENPGEPMAGSRFALRLPLTTGAPSGNGRASAPEPQDGPAFPAGGGTVLVVEADPNQRAGWACIAEAAGYRATGFGDREEALIELAWRAESGRPADVIIFSDHDAEAYEEVGRQIVDQAALGKPALVMLPAAGNPGDARRLMDAGFRGYLVKPVAPADLREILETLRRTPRGAWHTLFLTRHSLAEARRGHEVPDEDVEASLGQLLEQ